jgi:hypothetical protein
MAFSIAVAVACIIPPSWISELILCFALFPQTENALTLFNIKKRNFVPRRLT